MRTSVILVLALSLALGAAGAVFAAETTVTGYLRDSFCLVTMGVHGPNHHECAIACAKAGIPVLLKQNKTDKYFILLPPKQRESLPAGMLNKMEEEVTVTGNEYHKGGMTFLTVKSFK